jgi:hypothetical protein
MTIITSLFLPHLYQYPGIINSNLNLVACGSNFDVPLLDSRNDICNRANLSKKTTGTNNFTTDVEEADVKLWNSQLVPTRGGKCDRVQPKTITIINIKMVNLTVKQNVGVCLLCKQKCPARTCTEKLPAPRVSKHIAGWEA